MATCCANDCETNLSAHNEAKEDDFKQISDILL